MTDYRGSLYRVSPFGNLRIKGCSAPPRSVSPPRCVLHRHFESRHPPYALNFLLGKLKTTFIQDTLTHISHTTHTLTNRFVSICNPVCNVRKDLITRCLPPLLKGACRNRDLIDRDRDVRTINLSTKKPLEAVNNTKGV